MRLHPNLALLSMIFCALPVYPAVCEPVAVLEQNVRLLKKCDPEQILSGDGGSCFTVTVTNSSPAGSSQTFTAVFANGSTQTATLSPGESHTFNYNMTSIKVHETGSDEGRVTWTLS